MQNYTVYKRRCTGRFTHANDDCFMYMYVVCRACKLHVSSPPFICALLPPITPLPFSFLPPPPLPPSLPPSLPLSLSLSLSLPLSLPPSLPPSPFAPRNMQTSVLMFSTRRLGLSSHQRLLPSVHQRNLSEVGGSLETVVGNNTV